MSKIQSVTDSTAVEFVKEGVSLLDFYAPWCPPCNALTKILEPMSENHKIAKVNVDECSELAEEYKIEAIPVLIFFKDGNVAKRMVGLKSKAEIEAAFSELEKV